MAATYSFRHREFDFWAKLLPNSTLYIDQKYEAAATSFLKRYPWVEIYSVPRLHSKVVFFEKNGVLLVGSENLYSCSSFSEVMIETFVSEDNRKAVTQLLFGDLPGKLLFCKYGVNDIKLHCQGWFDEGTPFLPCNREVDLRDLVKNEVAFGPKGLQPPNPEYHWPGRLYVVFEYVVDGIAYYLALDRSYDYCGDLDKNAFDWLMGNCVVTQIYDWGYDGGQFPSYHPIPRGRYPDRAIWFGTVKNPEKFENIKQQVPRVEITHRKIRRNDP